MSFHDRRAPAHPTPEEVEAVVRAALAEDLGGGDLTAALIPPDTLGEATLRVREAAVLCGQAWFDAVFRTLDPAVTVDWAHRDGERMAAGAVVCRLRGPARAINTGERTALNLLQTLSGTATTTAAHVDALPPGSDTVILDTRKTLPGLRQAQKYAVSCGGGHNHRTGLFDAMLIKENHIAAAGSLRAAVQAARAAHPEAPMELEVESIDQLREALDLGVTMVMLDNFDDDAIREAVALARGRARLEVSGGVTGDEIARLAGLGVDYISIGGLTKHVQAVDFSLRLD